MSAIPEVVAGSASAPPADAAVAGAGAAPAAPTAVVQVKNLTFDYGSASGYKPVLTGITLELPKGV
jgi:hypothetical protein